MGEAKPRKWHWKIKETLLKETEYEGKLRQELESFFTINDTGETTPFCIWETHKCIMRGMFISMGAHRKRKLNEQIDSLLKSIGELETVHKKCQAQLIEQELAGQSEKFNLLLIDKEKAKLTRGRQTFYEFGEKTRENASKHS